VTYDELQVGDAVSFEVVEGEKGLAAKNVTRAMDASSGKSEPEGGN